MRVESIADDVLTCLKHNPEPKFQRRRFLDLPAELIHHIMSFSSEECCELGLCSRMLREASISYVYKVSAFHVVIRKKLIRRQTALVVRFTSLYNRHSGFRLTPIRRRKSPIHEQNFRRCHQQAQSTHYSNT